MDPIEAGGELKEKAPQGLSELWILLLLAAVQFTHIVDFMMMMPLGPQLMRELEISPAQFARLISSFAVTAGVVGLLAAPFIDRFDRKRLLMFCYAGFAGGTLLCGLSHTPGMLIFARAMCGAFGGVSSATIMAIVADVVPPERRARGMGILMIAFSAAAALGVPLGLVLAQKVSWETPFLVVAGVAALVWICLWRVLPPVRGHLEGAPRSFRDFFGLLQDRNAWLGLLLMVMTVFGHFTIIPFLSTFLVWNVGFPEGSLLWVYLVGGVASIVTGPWVGRLADRHSHMKVYGVMVVCASAVIYTLTNSGHRAPWEVLVIAACFFTFASGRFIPAQATISLAVPMVRRGAYMSLVGCSRDLASGLTTALGGAVVVEQYDGSLLYYNWLGWLAIGVSLASLWLFRKVKHVG